MWFCYILRNASSNTYNGSTNNMVRRLRQHDGAIVGGAKATRGKGPWEVYAFLTGFKDNMYHNALQCEWKIKYPDNKRPRPKKYCSPAGRIKGLQEVLMLPRWTNNSTLDNKDCNFKLYLVQDMEQYIDVAILPQNIQVIIVQKILLEHMDPKNYCSNIIPINNCQIENNNGLDQINQNSDNDNNNDDNNDNNDNNNNDNNGMKK
jgi:predicted GIY-YIG superfamily endonuclease